MIIKIDRGEFMKLNKFSEKIFLRFVYIILISKNRLIH